MPATISSAEKGSMLKGFDGDGEELGEGEESGLDEGFGVGEGSVVGVGEGEGDGYAVTTENSLLYSFELPALSVTLTRTEWLPSLNPVNV